MQQLNIVRNYQYQLKQKYLIVGYIKKIMKTSTKLNIAWIVLLLCISVLLIFFWIAKWQIGLMSTLFLGIIISGGYLISNK